MQTQTKQSYMLSKHELTLLQKVPVRMVSRHKHSVSISLTVIFKTSVTVNSGFKLSSQNPQVQFSAQYN